MSISIRNASRRDAADMAVLVDIAGHGLPAWLWQKGLRESPTASLVEIGRMRASRDEGDFSWKNCVVAEVDGQVAGMTIGYRQPEAPARSAPAGTDPILVPLVELEALAPGSWYLNAIAVYAEYRRHGVGGRLLAEAERSARNSAATAVSLIVEDVNAVAIALYRQAGFSESARRAYVPYPLGPEAQAWLLMCKPLGEAAH